MKKLQGLRSSFSACMGYHSSLLEVGETTRLGCVVPARTVLIERRLRNATDMAADGNKEGTATGKERRSKDAQPCGWFVACCLLLVVCLL